MKKKLRLRHRLPLLLAGIVVVLPAVTVAGICDRVEALVEFGANDERDNDYFNHYSVRTQAGGYLVLAVKEVAVSYQHSVHVLRELKKHAEFFPGYKKIVVREGEHGEVLTAIRFKPAFAFSESRFTNEVEQRDGQNQFQQCWWQLDDKDSRMIEKPKMAPDFNRGYWQVSALDSERVRFRYFSSIKPPFPIPDFLYKYIAESSYQEVFEHLIARIDSVDP